MKKRLAILFCIIIFGVILLALWWKQAIKPGDLSNTAPVKFTVSSGESSRSIAERLYKAGLIRSTVAFFLLARFGGFSDKIQAGDFVLNPSMDLLTVSNTLTHGTVDISVTIPEGWRDEEIALRLAQTLNIPETEFTKNAREGYMFPDTYRIPKDSSAAAVVQVMTDNFNHKVTTDIIDKAAGRGLTRDQLVIIASLVEREAKFDADRPLIASVILNRMKIGMKLDIDATIQYALGYQAADKSWWKKELTQEDLQVDSPFNTYLNPGLPPGPIANPGKSAIQAVVNAPENDYLYYIADKNGNSHFAATLEEQNANIAKYLNK
jgi:UPF0755 protein